MVQIFSILFGLIGVALVFDVVFNEGAAISSMLKSLRGEDRSNEENEKLVMCKKILEEIDSLRDDLEYDISEIEKDNIHQKIAIREKMLEKLL